jgi:serine/threonine protein kinase/Flp pilus assembly protein TadD
MSLVSPAGLLSIAPPVHKRLEAVKAGWDGGTPPDARDALGRDPDLGGDRAAALDLAYEEYLRRREAGEVLDAEAFCERFPECRRSLLRLVRMHDELSRLPAELPLPAELLGPPCWPGPGEQVGDFTLLRELGRGAFARVFLATEASAGDRPVVVKLSPGGDAEARTLGPLSHANVVPVLSCRRDPARRLVVVCMPFRGTATLEEVCDRLFAPGARPPRRAARLLEAVRAAAAPGDPPADAAAPHPSLLGGDYAAGVLHLGARLAGALAFLHQRGVVHRDLKPSNVLLGPDGTPHLLDFNLAADPAADRSRVGGTLPYAAPEHIRAIVGPAAGPPPDARADLFALGAVLYELLTGTHPFGPVPVGLPAEKVASVLLDRQRAGCRPLRVPGLDRAAARLIERCLAFDPARRPADATELAEGLQAAFRPARRLRRWAIHRRWWLAGAACLVAVAAPAATYWAPGVADRPASPGEVVEDVPRRAYAAGVRAFRAGKYDEAGRHFSRALETDAQDLRSRFARGCTRLKQSLTAKGLVESDLLTAAARDFMAITVASPQAGPLATDPWVCECAAYCYARRGEHGLATAMAEQATRMGPPSTALLNNRAYSYMNRGQFVEADKDLRAIDVRDRLLPPVCANRAVLVLQRRTADHGLVVPAWALEDMRQAVRDGGDMKLCHLAAFLFAYAAEDAGRLAAAVDALSGAGAGWTAPVVSARSLLLDEALGYLRAALDRGLPPLALKDPTWNPYQGSPAFQALSGLPTRPSVRAPSCRLIDPVGELPD